MPIDRSVSAMMIKDKSEVTSTVRRETEKKNGIEGAAEKMNDHRATSPRSFIRR